MFPPEERGGADHARAGVLPRHSSLPARLPRSAVLSTGGTRGRKHAGGGANTPCSWGSVNRRPWGPASLCPPFANASAQEGLFSDLSAKESPSSDSKKVPCGLTSTQRPAATGPTDQVTSSQAWEQEAHLRLQICTSFPECSIKPGFEAMLETVLSFPWVFLVLRSGDTWLCTEVQHKQPREQGGIQKPGMSLQAALFCPCLPLSAPSAAPGARGACVSVPAGSPEAGQAYGLAPSEPQPQPEAFPRSRLRRGGRV